MKSTTTSRIQKDMWWRKKRTSILRKLVCREAIWRVQCFTQSIIWRAIFPTRWTKKAKCWRKTFIAGPRWAAIHTSSLTECPAGAFVDITGSPQTESNRKAGISHSNGSRRHNHHGTRGYWHEIVDARWLTRHEINIIIDLAADRRSTNRQARLTYLCLAIG